MASDELTLVTGLLNLGRGDLDPAFARSFQDYQETFSQLLEVDVPLVAYVDQESVELVRSARPATRTKIIVTSTADLEALPIYEAVQAIRSRPDWRGRAAWLGDSPQARLPHYNPMVMSKLCWLAEQSRDNPFDTGSFAWIDAGITRTTAHGHLVRPDLGTALAARLESFLFLCYPYIGASEIHGFEREAMASLCQTPYVEWVARGGFFGGRRDHVLMAERIYRTLLEDSLDRGLMGTEESVFTILAHLHPRLIERFELEDNGLVGPFFESIYEERA